MNRIGIDIVMLLSLLLGAHQHQRFHFAPNPGFPGNIHEPPPVVCNTQLVCK